MSKKFKLPYLLVFSLASFRWMFFQIECSHENDFHENEWTDDIHLVLHKDSFQTWLSWQKSTWNWPIHPWAATAGLFTCDGVVIVVVVKVVRALGPEDPSLKTHMGRGGRGIESPSHNALQLNCTTNYEFMIDHHSYTHNLSSCEIKAWKKIQAWMVFKPMTSAVTEQWSTDWAIMPSGSWSLSEFVMYL